MLPVAYPPVVVHLATAAPMVTIGVVCNTMLLVAMVWASAVRLSTCTTLEKRTDFQPAALETFNSLDL